MSTDSGLFTICRSCNGNKAAEEAFFRSAALLFVKARGHQDFKRHHGPERCAQLKLHFPILAGGVSQQMPIPHP